MVYIRSGLATDRKIQYEFREIESIGVKVTSGNEKWFFGGVYKPPSMSNEHFYTDFGQRVDKMISKYDKYILIGDFNYDMLNGEKSAMLQDILDT
jgi:exonuclease III